MTSYLLQLLGVFALLGMVSSQCGDLFPHSLYGYNGSFYNPEYPSPYSTNLICEWQIYAYRGYIVRLNVQTFGMQDCETCAFVSIHDGEYFSAPQLTKLYNSFTNDSVETSLTKAYIRFQTDSTNITDFNATAYGFKIDWVAVQDTWRACHGDSWYFGGTNGTFYNPSYPEPYAPGLQCDWHISVDYPNVISLTIETFTMQDCETCDFVTIHDGWGTDKPLLTKQFSSYSTATVITTTYDAYIRWKTDGNETGDGKIYGFRIDWQMEEDKYFGCYNSPLQVQAPNGTIHNANFPEPYAPNKQCDWIISILDYDHIARLTVRTYAMENCKNCDYLTVRDGNSIGGKELVTLRESNQEKIVVTTRTAAFIRWKTDRSNYGNGSTYGFTVDWEKIEDPWKACHGYFYSSTHPTGTLTNPNYPNPYAADKYCQWYMYVGLIGEGYRIRIKIQTFGMEGCEDCDYLSIEDGLINKYELARVYEPFSNVTVDTTSYDVIITWKTNERYTGQGSSYGFRLEWERYVDNTVGCDGVAIFVTGNSGTISNPDFPLPYASDQTCDWIIIVDKSSRIRMTLETFSLDDYSDHVTIHNGSSLGDSVLFSTKTPFINESLVSSSSSVYVRWDTDYANYGKGKPFGFNLHWEVIGTPINNANYLALFIIVGTLSGLIFCVAVFLWFRFFYKRQEQKLLPTSDGRQTAE